MLVCIFNNTYGQLDPFAQVFSASGKGISCVDVLHTYTYRG